MVEGADRRTRKIVTMLSVSQAKVGETFIYRGYGQKCPGCKYFRVCAENLNEGRVYKVINMRKRTFRCEAYDVEMRVVDVVEAEIEAAVPSKQAIEGIILTFHPQDCSNELCENYMLCSPIGLIENDRCEVVRVHGRISCSRGLQLVKVLLRRVPSS